MTDQLRAEIRPLLDDLSRRREHAERHIVSHRSLGAPFIAGAERELREIERSERTLYAALNAAES